MIPLPLFILRQLYLEALWTMFNFEVWARMFIDGERPEVISDELMGCNSHADVPAAIG